MDISLLETNGYALDAKVEVESQVLIVMDDISNPGGKHPLGLVRDVEIGYLTVNPNDWEATFSGNPDHLKTLLHCERWNYLGYGQIVKINPVMIDFGIFTLQYDDLRTSDERCVGEYVVVKIDRLSISKRAV